MKLLITGGNGFIGANLIIKILEEHKDYKILNLIAIHMHQILKFTFLK